jgi:UPF0271 protein
MAIDLNSDMGEGFGPWTMGDDAAMLDIVTSANVACGWHAGDPNIMVQTAALAKAKGVAIGAHPGFGDLWGFGRRTIRGHTMTELERMVAYQIGALQACAALGGHRATYVKAHGALANLANDEDDIALAIGRAIKGVDRGLVYMVMPGLATERAAGTLGLDAVREVYADRAYADNGNLASRKTPGAVLHDAGEAAERVLRMVGDQAIVTVTGQRLPARIETVCVHGDTPGAVAMARTVRRTLEANGVAVAPFRP